MVLLTPRDRALRDAEQERCCDVLAQVPPDAPTLCERWTAHDLAAHLWSLKQPDPRWWVGSGSRRRIAALQDEVPYDQLVADLRAARAGFACMPDDRFNHLLHSLGELVVHTEDAARPAGITRGPLPPELDRALWRRAGQAAAILHRRRTPGLVLRWSGGPSRRVTKGPERVTVTGAPLEVLLWVYGRDEAADVVITG